MYWKKVSSCQYIYSQSYLYYLPNIECLGFDLITIGVLGLRVILGLFSFVIR
jgi:hypothetical protein